MQANLLYDLMDCNTILLEKKDNMNLNSQAAESNVYSDESVLLVTIR